MPGVVPILIRFPLLLACGVIGVGVLAGWDGPAAAQTAPSTVVTRNGVQAQKPSLPLTETKILGTTPGQCLAVQADGTVGGTVCVISCPSAAVPDFGACIAASPEARQINIRDGDFATDKLIDLSGRPGQALHFGVGTYTLPGIRVADSTSAMVTSNTITGEGEARTVLQQSATASGPVISDAHFAVLTGTNSFFGAGYLRLSGLTVNAGPASADCVVKIYGYAMVFRDVTIQNGGTCGRYTEWANNLSKAPLLPFNQQGNFDHVTEYNSKTNGVIFLGPLDSVERFGTSYKNGMWAFYVTQGLHASYLQAIESDFAHPGTTGSIYVNGIGGQGTLPGALDGEDVFADGYTGTMIYYGPNNAPLKLSHSNIAGGEIGLDLEGGFGNTFTGEIESTSGTALKINGGDLTGHFYMADNKGYWFDFVHEPHPDTFAVIGGDGLGTAFKHMPSGADSLTLLNLPAFGPNHDNKYVSGPQCTFVEGKRVCFPGGPGTIAETVSAGKSTVLPLNDASASAQAKVSFQAGGAPKFECGKQADGSFYCYDVAKGLNFLAVDPNGNVTVGEGPNSTVFSNANGNMLVRGDPTFSALKAKTGTRYLCIDTAGHVTSSAVPCSGS